MKQFLVLILLLCSTNIFAQDVIVKKDGSTIVCRVVNLTESEIVYKKWSDLNGSNYVMERSAASAINYQNGKKVKLSEATNLYKPNNQNDGVQQYNDRALLAIDAKNRNYTPQKAKNLRIIGWIGTGLTIAGGIGVLASIDDFDHGERTFGQVCIGVAALGAATAITCFVAANSIKKKERFNYLSIYQHDFKLSNGTILSANIDMLNDRATGTNNLGLGLRYNF